MSKMVAGILAHVDAGKTTLSEGMLYLSGSIRKLGRVDHRDAFLDTYELERARGITIFSKQARFVWKKLEVTLLDTPGHVDFSTEMERALQVLDYAVLVISGSDGVQAHTETLWRLLSHYSIPVFLFVNKMDLPGCDREQLMQELRKHLSGECVDFTEEVSGRNEMLAMCSEELLEEYMDTANIKAASVAKAIAAREVFPVYFGSALKLDGVEELLDGLEEYVKTPEYPKEFGARVYKIGRDDAGARLTYLKITGGRLKVKEKLSDEEKVEQIRIYNGSKYESVEQVDAGEVCAVLGAASTWSGQGLGIEETLPAAMLAPVMNYRLVLQEGTDPVVLLQKLRQLQEEEPLLHVTWKEALREIHLQLMGNVQLEIIRSMIQERFGVAVEFDEGSIVYRETIAAPVEGMGHYEPLRHYAEVHILMEPGEPGSGLIFDSSCSEDVLDRNWQRLILTHLEEREHLGVLTGSPITDMKLTLVAGRAHIKHTEGGDFRQATYRAVRHGLMRTQSVLLEPYYEFRMELPGENLGRAMSDVERMHGTFESPEYEGDKVILNGAAPVATMQGYAAELVSYTRGTGRLTCNLCGYRPCHNTGEVIKRIAYDAESDLENSADSIFCAHGAGFLVPWREAANYMHLEGIALPPEAAGKGAAQREQVQSEVVAEPVRKSSRSSSYGGSYAEDKELEAIFTRTFGEVKTRLSGTSAALGEENRRRTAAPESRARVSLPEIEKLPEYLLVDGYNVVFAWEELAELAKENLESARMRLMDILCNYQGFTKKELILVFDAYRVKGNHGEAFDYHNIHIVYTKEAETADMYIERVTHEIGKKYRVTVATSDRLEQLIIIGQGAVRMSARELKEEVERVTTTQLQEYLSRQPRGKNEVLKQALDKVQNVIE